MQARRRLRSADRRETSLASAKRKTADEDTMVQDDELTRTESEQRKRGGDRHAISLLTFVPIGGPTRRVSRFFISARQPSPFVADAGLQFPLQAPSLHNPIGPPIHFSL